MTNDTIIICTPDELVAMHARGEVDDNGYCIKLDVLFEVLCDHYGTDAHWSPNDVY